MMPEIYDGESLPVELRRRESVHGVVTRLM
jgi:hypothetical protein